MRSARYPFAAGLAIFALTGCSGTSNASLASHPASPTPNAAAAICRRKFLAWSQGGGSTKYQAVYADALKVVKAGTNVRLLQAASGPLVADSKAFLADLPPGCVPEPRIDVAAALEHFIASARYIQKGDDANRDAAFMEFHGAALAFQQIGMDVQQFMSSNG